MKRVTAVIIIVMLCFIICSCGKEATPTNQSDVSDIAVPTEYNKENTDGSDAASRSTMDALAYYSEFYSAKAVYQDKFNTLKYILVSEKNIVEVLAIDGFDQATVISIENIERVENKSLADFKEIKVFDKTNQSISVFLDFDKGEELFTLIETSDHSENI